MAAGSMLRQAALGAATGFTLGYAAVRAAQALRDLRTPYPPRTPRDPQRYGAERRAFMLAGTRAASPGSRRRRSCSPIRSSVRCGRCRARSARRRSRSPCSRSTRCAMRAAITSKATFVERVYGTSDQSARGWLADQAKGAAVAAVVTAVLVALADAHGRARAAPLAADRDRGDAAAAGLRDGRRADVRDAAVQPLRAGHRRAGAPDPRARVALRGRATRRSCAST